MTIKRLQDMSVNRVVNGVTGKQSRYSAVTINSFPYYDTDPLVGMVAGQYNNYGQIPGNGNLNNLSNTLYAGSLQSISDNIHGDYNAFYYGSATVTFRTFVADSNDVSVFPSLVVGKKYCVAKCAGNATLTYKNNLPVLIAGIGAGGGGGVTSGGGGGAGVFYSTSYNMKRISNGISVTVGGATLAGVGATDASGYATGNAYGAGTFVTAIDNSSNYILACEGGNPGSSPNSYTNYYGAGGGYLSGSSTSDAGWNSYGTGGGGAGSTVASANSPTSMYYYLGGEAYSTSIYSTWDSTAPFVSANRKAYNGGNGSLSPSYSTWRAGGGGGGTRTAGSAPTYASTLGYGTLSSYAVSGASGEQIGGLGGRGIPWCQVFSATNDGTEIGVGGQGCHSFTLSSNPNATAINAALTSLLGNSGMSYGGQHIVSGGVDQTGSTSSKGMDGAANTGNGGGGNPVSPASTSGWGSKGGSGCVWVVFKVIG
ncbi:hypothetical protein UFOVP967_3 [uncultured Caudovirales phage]|uniref:Uncharacterized protein n=1 Tax=uncultured Caudovirales phage TaxID=2100421 RepID=A0A6J5PWS2_9CAUD|nr:hypothetical protein UFOVP521_11 [uncultured Caudovirales phage]CAB4167995.1 hypothetical protein UFOVP856_84 [uncultured Caudovirales phage]CAB4173705.1 hypothetical protein UFOVP967_3 [uncultured Caudovirales phage]CAB4180674.1 hypothetical protein UFOVP1036_77 [uncultured Caudovirales phage]CAB4186336.1 hypothetical protein UFOVP1132_91 [uncultured Caudovirales phage]